jgi:hypothetical protein
MSKVGAQQSMRSLIVVVAIAVGFSLFTLCLIESWIKYPLSVFEMLTIIVLFLIFSGYDFRLSVIGRIRIENLGVDLMDAFLIVSASGLLILNVLHAQGGLIQVVLALFITSVLPGHALLRTFGLNHYFSKLENMVFSFILSYAFTGFLTLALLFMSEKTRLMSLLGSCILLGLISLLKRRKQRVGSTPKSFAKNVDALGILITMTFFAISLYFVYPGFALLPGTDISRHYASSVILWRTPELYTGFNYMFAHLHESALIAISMAPEITIQTALATLTIIMPFAFYAMAKSYFESVDARLAILSTIVYCTFSGFAWVYLSALKLEGVEQTGLGLLSLVNNKTYNGSMYIPQPLLWFVPFFVSFTTVIIQLTLLRKFNMDKKSFVALYALLTVVSYLTHITEVVIFSLFLCFYAFFSRSRVVRLDDGILASLIGLVAVNIFYAIQQVAISRSLSFSMNLALMAPLAILGLTYAYRTFHIQSRIVAHLPKLHIRSIIIACVYAGVFVYVLGLFTWMALAPSFQLSTVYSIGFIPWFYYPVILGTVGLLGTVGFLGSILKEQVRKHLMPFVCLVVFSIIFGRSLTYISLNFFVSGYQEGRLVAYLFLGLSIPASMASIKILDGIASKVSLKKKAFCSTLLIGIIATSGCQSTFLLVEYWHLHTVTDNLPSDTELQALEFMRDLYAQDKSAWGLTLSSTSSDMLAFATPVWIEGNSQYYAIATSPEIPLLCLKASPPVNASHPYLYMADRDSQFLGNYPNSWMASHFLPLLSPIFTNDKTNIYNISDISFPQAESRTVLVMPFDTLMDPHNSWLYIYDILSLGKYNYTVACDLDTSIFSHETLVLSFDPVEEDVLHKSFEDNFSYIDGNSWETLWHSAAINDTYKSWRTTTSFRVSDGQMFVGFPSHYEYGALLTDISALNFTVELTNHILDFDPSVQNSALIIYGYRDPNNYRAFVINYHSDGYIHIYISRVTEGKSFLAPEWPGLNTGVRFTKGTIAKITGEVKGDIHILTVIAANQTCTVETTYASASGRIGIASYDAFSQAFDDFKVNGSYSVQQRSGEEYIDYVRRGGQLIILNTNGYGYFADRMLQIENTSIDADEINGPSNLKLPVKLSLSETTPRTEGINVIALYSSNSSSSPYAVEEKIGSGRIVYVNLYPLSEAIRLTNEKSIFCEMLGDLIEPTGIQLEHFQYKSQPTFAAVYENVEFRGKVEIDTSQIFFPADLRANKIEIVSESGDSVSLFNVTGIRILNYDNVSIAAAEVGSRKGRGFYAALNFKSQTIIKTNGNNVSVTVSRKDNDEVTLACNEIRIDENPPTLLARQPFIQCIGTTVFKKLYSSGTIYQKTACTGQDISINGTVRVAIYLSDAYSYANSLEASGAIQRNPPIVQYNEFSSLSQAAFYSIILIPIFVAIWAMTLHRRKITDTENGDE